MNMTKNTMSIITTKSGTKVYVVGMHRDQKLRDVIGDRFVNYYNRNFTIKEQRQIGNIYYDMYNKDHTNTQVPYCSNDWVACTGTFTGEDLKKLNPFHKKMVDMYFKSVVRDDESTITHEIIHAKKFMLGLKDNQHNERKIDFEAVGRISRKGIKDMQHGYYFHPTGNTSLAKKKDISIKKKGTIAKQGIIDDRILLTGSVNHSIIGKPIEKKVNKLFRKSFFFKKIF